MRWMQRWDVSALAILLAGCVMTPRAINTRADVGARPEQYEQTIREHLRMTLLDPNSVQDFRISEPELASCMIASGHPFYGWRVISHYNAKNAYGGYVGLQQSVYWFHGERIVLRSVDTHRCPEGW
jgi:starvation-inducible outer membrane lipoprotein